MRTINYKVSYENMISRLPGLFAYLEENEFGDMVLHKATDRDMGCYGMVVQNIKLPSDCTVCEDDINEEQDVLTVPDAIVSEDAPQATAEEGKTVILEGGETYSYRTLMTYYYRLKKLGKENNFTEFIEKGIGKVKVDEGCKVDSPAVPDYIFLADARRMYNELFKLKIKCEFYEQKQEKFGNDSEACCLCERYHNLNNGKFLDFLKDKIDEAETTAKDFYEKYAVNDIKQTLLNLSVDLTESYQDLGIMTPYVPHWMPYVKKYSGEKVFYDGKIWIVKAGEEDKIIETSGKWNEETERMEFDYENYEEYDINKDGIKKFISEEDSILKYKDLPFEIEGKTDRKLPDLRRFATYLNLNGAQERPKKGEDWLFYYRKGLVTNIKSLTDDLGNVLKLSSYKDGKIVTATEKDGGDLLSYGDVITDISVGENNTITFTYILGVHVTAQLAEIKTDDDGNKLYFWKNYGYDETEGIKYRETYNYIEGSDLDRLIKKEIKFTEKDDNGKEVEKTIYFNREMSEDEEKLGYVNGDYDKHLKDFKFEFLTENNEFYYDKRVANSDVHITSIMSDFSVVRHNFDEFMDSENFRYDYFNGISYSPTRRIDVNIDRGVTSVFDKHLRFSEIKTFEDLETYQNGSFFRMSEG